ncbi:hypothetical protein [Pontibacillus marinus]|uniref:Uncharacterized protein n=1 Tax=Pontibacillus marinus BH030004 = DSM 16465 TaxID=1385511 RepID=A0A0A5GBH1_9BACI|nr:hypothetical protein [Pontibacillus marinus]KGX90501.1 hypothetical protein N783_16880 [Pontibacillus marinus BH030004 = DSM 16465]
MKKKLSYVEKELFERELNRLIQLRKQINETTSPYLPQLDSQIDLLKNVLEESEMDIKISFNSLEKQ